MMLIVMIKPKKARHDSDDHNQRCDTASQHLSRDQDMDRGDQVSWDLAKVVRNKRRDSHFKK